MNTGKSVLGILAGVAIGSVMGLLLAPDKGSSTRKKIKNKSDVLVDDLKQKLNNLVDGLSDKMEAMRKEEEDFAAKSKAKFNSMKDEAKKAIV